MEMTKKRLLPSDLHMEFYPSMQHHELSVRLPVQSQMKWDYSLLPQNQNLKINQYSSGLQ